ncbi:MAG: glycosyltransferase family 4 protein [Ardenticatenia bacterium]|nr:glycosyltransferase family 4 protein [Ardenticatenia bacterium]
MRVLHIIQRYWPALGGAEVHLGEISERLANEGHQVTVATTDALDVDLFWNPSRRRIQVTEEWKDGVRIRRFPVRHLPFPQLAYPAWRRLLWILSMSYFPPVGLSQRLSRFTPWVPDLWRWLEQTEESFDLVAGMTICFEALLEAGLRFARRRGIPFVIYPLTHLGAGTKPGNDPVSRFYTMRHQIALVRESDTVIVQTPTERAFYQQHGVSPDQILIVSPGVNPEDTLGGNGTRFRKRHNIQGPLILFLSSMSYDKGAFHLVEAVRVLWQSGREVELVLAGTILEEFRNFFQELPTKDQQRLRILGPITDEEKRDLLDAADIVVMPSRTDSFGIIYLEAWLYRKPVIGARAWGIDDVIEHGRDGLLVPFGNVSALAEAIAYLLDHPEKRDTMGAYGKQKVYQQHTWEKKYRLIKNLYMNLTGH